MNTFEIGKEYFSRSICDNDCIFTIKITGRTAKTVSYEYMGESRRSKLRIDESGEYIQPDRYSMAPVFRAAREVQVEEAPTIESAAAETAVIGINVTSRGSDYMDFTVSSDAQNLYRYESFTGKLRKLFGVGPRNFGQAIRGKERARVESLARTVFESGLPFGIAI